MSDYPKFLYRHHPAANLVDGIPCEILQVLDADEEKAGKADGWHDNVAAAAPEARKSSSDDDPRPALRAQYEALSGKKAFGGWSAEQLQSKIEALNG